MQYAAAVLILTAAVSGCGRKEKAAEPAKAAETTAETAAGGNAESGKTEAGNAETGNAEAGTAAAAAEAAAGGFFSSLRSAAVYIDADRYRK